MFMSSQNSYVGILIPKAMTFGNGTSGRWLGHGRPALMKGISIPDHKRDPPTPELPAPPVMWGHSKSVCNQGEDSFQNLAMLACSSQNSSFQNSET